MTSKFKMMREFLVFQWEHHDAQVKNLRAEIRLLEKRKRKLWDAINLLDRLEKEKEGSASPSASSESKEVNE